MNDFITRAKEYLNESANKRTQKMCQKLEESSKETKIAYFFKVIQECSYNQTTNKPVKPEDPKKGKKQVRKKTSEELRLLKYFLDQDPEWTPTTVAAVSQILNFSPYQVYKWGYDRKNKKAPAPKPQFVKEDLTAISSEKKAESGKTNFTIRKDTNLNMEVDELLKNNANYKNIEERPSEFLTNELNFESDRARYWDETHFIIKSRKRIYKKLFTITKTNKRAKRDYSSEDELDQIWQGWHSKYTSEYFQFNQDGESNHVKSEREFDCDANERESDLTGDKSSTSNVLRNNNTEKLSQFCENATYPR